MKKIFGICAFLVSVALLVSSGAWAAEAPVPSVQPEPKLFYYFGSGNVKYGFSRFNEDCLSPTSNPNERQITNVATHTNAIMELGWGDQKSIKGRQSIADCMVKRLIAAKAHGIKVAIAAVDFILWDYIPDGTNTPLHFYRGDDVVLPELGRFFEQLERNNVLDMVRRGYCYIMDEPELYGITEVDMERAIGAVQKAAAKLPGLGQCKTYVIYSYGRGYPAVRFVDKVGHDHYEIGARIIEDGEFERFRAMLRPLSDPNPQMISLVPGGAFGQDPAPFTEKMAKDPQVASTTGFIFIDGWEEGRPGIHGNGMAEAYCIAGKKVLNPEVEEPDCTSPPPEVSLSVNEEKYVTVSAGETLCYRWNATGTNARSTFTSYWWSSNSTCSYGLNGGGWVADSEAGEFCWPVDKAQAGCTYTITYAACGSGAECRADAIGVTIRDPNQKK